MTVARTLSLVYGSLTTGGASAATFNIDGYPSYSERRDTDAISASVSWTIIVSGATTAALAANVATLQSAMTNPFQRFQWKEGSSTFIDWNPSNDSGFNAAPHVELIGGPPDTGLTRRYRCSVSVGLPADGNSGRVSSSVRIVYDKSDIRTVTFAVDYTAQGGTGALANAQAKLPTFAASVLSGLGGTYEKLGSGDFDRDDQDKLCSASIQYREINYDQSAAGTDLASVVDHAVTFQRTTTGPGDSPGGPYGQAKRLVEAVGAYSANVDSTATKDLKALWENTLRTYVINQAKTNLGLSTVAVIEDAPTYDKTGNIINCRLRIFGVASGTKAFEYRVSQTRRENPGALIRRTWDGRYTGIVYEGPATTVRTTTITAVLNQTTGIASVDGMGQLVAGASGNAPGTGVVPPPKKSGWIRNEGVPSYTPLSYGVPGLPGPIPATLFNHTITETWIQGSRGQSTSVAPTKKTPDFQKPASRPTTVTASAGSAIRPGGR